MENVPSDELLGIVVPIGVYWTYSGIYMMLGSLEKYRLHSRKDEDIKNLVSKREVVNGVLAQQLVQATVAFLLFKVSKNSSEIASTVQTPFIVLARQFFIGMFVIDTWQYFWHRYMHSNKFLYRHIHSWH
ncbi:sphinganine C4-monooxygenase 2-like, partial [Phoenix dactylifera]|uniref:Sphinganine C4-monooxygenase 2-like n=1 Tax=Phoenix dactylifera TaxID=42345 RepID=A0A8B7C324_PHODC